MVMFKVIAFTPDDYERVVYVASDRQVHQQLHNMQDRVSFTTGGVGLVIDPKDFPEGTRFLIVREEK